MACKTNWKGCDEEDLSGYTVIIPSVAAGNVGQLACDLLISSLSMKKYGSIHSPALVPVVGYDPYDLDSDNLSSCCELYRCPVRRVVVMQLRAPLVYKYAREFLRDVVRTLKERDVKDIVVLTSSYAHEKKHIQTLPFRYVASDDCPYLRTIRAANWVAHEVDGCELKIYGGGFASLLYSICQEQELPCLVLYKYCSEGDNIPDAYDMVACLNQALPLFDDTNNITTQLLQPVSWKLLFGRPPPIDIY